MKSTVESVGPEPGSAKIIIELTEAEAHVFGFSTESSSITDRFQAMLRHELGHVDRTRREMHRKGTTWHAEDKAINRAVKQDKK